MAFTEKKFVNSSSDDVYGIGLAHSCEWGDNCVLKQSLSYVFYICGSSMA